MKHISLFLLALLIMQCTPKNTTQLPSDEKTEKQENMELLMNRDYLLFFKKNMLEPVTPKVLTDLEIPWKNDNAQAAQAVDDLYKNASLKYIDYSNLTDEEAAQQFPKTYHPSFKQLFYITTNAPSSPSSITRTNYKSLQMNVDIDKPVTLVPEWSMLQPAGNSQSLMGDFSMDIILAPTENAVINKKGSFWVKITHLEGYEVLNLASSDVNKTFMIKGKEYTLERFRDGYMYLTYNGKNDYNKDWEDVKFITFNKEREPLVHQNFSEFGSPEYMTFGNSIGGSIDRVNEGVLQLSDDEFVAFMQENIKQKDPIKTFRRIHKIGYEFDSIAIFYPRYKAYPSRELKVKE